MEYADAVIKKPFLLFTCHKSTGYRRELWLFKEQARGVLQIVQTFQTQLGLGKGSSSSVTIATAFLLNLRICCNYLCPFSEQVNLKADTHYN